MTQCAAPVVEARFEPCGVAGPLEIVSLEGSLARLQGLGACGLENECVPPGWQTLPGYSGVTVMEDGGGRYLTNTDAYQTTRIVGSLLDGGKTVVAKYEYQPFGDACLALSL